MTVLGHFNYISGDNGVLPGGGGGSDGETERSPLWTQSETINIKFCTLICVTLAWSVCEPTKTDK